MAFKRTNVQVYTSLRSLFSYFRNFLNLRKTSSVGNGLSTVPFWDDFRLSYLTVFENNWSDHPGLCHDVSLFHLLSLLKASYTPTPSIAVLIAQLLHHSLFTRRRDRAISQKTEENVSWVSFPTFQNLKSSDSKSGDQLLSVFHEVENFVWKIDEEQFQKLQFPNGRDTSFNKSFRSGNW